MKNLSIIVAVACNRAIGNRNKLLYWLPNDLKRFKRLTSGHTIIMGRNTFESLPKGALPDRRNLVLSHRPLDLQGAEVFSSLDAAVGSCPDGEEVFIIGGASVYGQAMEMADRIYLTLVEDTPGEADAFFPEIDEEQWEVVGREAHEPDEKHRFPYVFVDYCRKR